MGDAGLKPLQIVDMDEEACRFGGLLETMAGVPRPVRALQATTPMVAEFGLLVALVKRLEQRVEALEAELVPAHRSRKCPCCRQLSLRAVVTRPHPALGAEGIELHDVRCSCGYRGSRLHDPRNFLR